MAKSVKHAAECAAQQVVVKAFEDIFLTRAQRMFDANPKVRFALFVEDDMSFREGIGKKELLAALGDARAKAAAWLGCSAVHFRIPTRFAQRSQTPARSARNQWEQRDPALVCRFVMLSSGKGGGAWCS